jgi:hypothetical protein
MAISELRDYSSSINLVVNEKVLTPVFVSHYAQFIGAAPGNWVGS